MTFKESWDKVWAHCVNCSKCEQVLITFDEESTGLCAKCFEEVVRGILQ